MTASTLADNLRFLRALVARPKNVGAVFPSGPVLARAIARQIEPGGPVLELGPGTGVVTAAILERGVAAAQLTLVEYDENFVRHNRSRFPGVHVIQGDAFNLDHTLMGRPQLPFAAIISGLPLLNFPLAMRKRLMDGVLTRLAPGAPFIQFSYGTHAPVAPPPGFGVIRAGLVWANIPPARVWVYRRS
jgi:phosphatidylethanolamine/phosphatidyl-N-methylethanolamine N-methyltransferase